MTTATLLVELLTEELPPKSLARLAEAFRKALTEDLQQDGFLTSNSKSRFYATPRRLAVAISEVLDVAPDSEELVKGPSVKAGLDDKGNPTRALLGFVKKWGAEVSALIKISDGKQEVFAYRNLAKGSRLETNLEVKVAAALKRLPVAKMMRWGDGDAEFVRPAHGLMMLHGKSVVPGTVLGVTSGNKTRGHRFMSKGELLITDAEAYETALAKEGMVIADFAKRRTMIDELLQAAAKKLQAALGDYQALLDEVTALVEHPSVYVGTFDVGFLEIPAECLILTMRQNQKYFPLFDSAGKLTNKFLIVSNMQVADPAPIISGNQRVIRPRLEDARFFYTQDRKARLETRVPLLGKVVYHNKLGTQLERVGRVEQLAGKIARALQTDHVLAERAARLAKADLTTGMVGEFPELQGIMGRYYALHDGEPAAVADAIAEHYLPRYAGDQLPVSPAACAVALADKLETLAGLFGIGQLPTGDRDPYALRRHALGVIRILIERDLPLSLHDLVNDAFSVFDRALNLGQAHTDLQIFFLERMRSYFADAGYTAQEIDAVLSMNPVAVNKIPLQLAAVRAFSALPEAASLAAANKRVANILRQAAAKGEVVRDADQKLLQEPAERALYDALKQASGTATPLFKKGDYTGYLKTFAVLKAPVDAFFDSVMVMAEETELRRNRIALLEDLRREMNQIADISKLAT